MQGFGVRETHPPADPFRSDMARPLRFISARLDTPRRDTPSHKLRRFSLLPELLECCQQLRSNVWPDHSPRLKKRRAGSANFLYSLRGLASHRDPISRARLLHPIKESLRGRGGLRKRGVKIREAEKGRVFLRGRGPWDNRTGVRSL